MSAEPLVIELSVNVAGSLGEVWRAVASGPGISAWYVPHAVEERTGGAATASFGPGPEMQVPGRVALWDPPRRVVFDGGPGVEGLEFDWSVAAAAGGSCSVRLRNSGFTSDPEGRAHRDALAAGWELFLLNLQLHRAHFPGQEASASLPMATWAMSRDDAWVRLTSALGIPRAPEVGDRLEMGLPNGAELAGVVVDTAAWRVVLLLDRPAPGTGFIAVEGSDAEVSVSVWTYLYGDEREEIAEVSDRQWRRWLEELG